MSVKEPTNLVTLVSIIISLIILNLALLGAFMHITNLQREVLSSDVNALSSTMSSEIDTLKTKFDSLHKELTLIREFEDARMDRIEEDNKDLRNKVSNISTKATEHYAKH